MFDGLRIAVNGACAQHEKQMQLIVQIATVFDWMFREQLFHVHEINAKKSECGCGCNIK